MSTGRYHRFDLHSERKRRYSVLLQKSVNGTPCYVESADFTDWARIVRKMIQRVGNLGNSGAHGAEAWKLAAAASPDNNFLIKGGDNSDVGAAEAWLSGLVALLYRDVDYLCEQRLGEFSPDDAFDVHHRATSVSAGVLVDKYLNLRVDALVGQSVRIVGAGDFVVAANTASQLTLVGFDPADYPDLPGTPYYFVLLAPPEAAAEQPVYLDVHLEDWGMVEDAALNHNPGGSPVECARREVLIQRVWVRQNADLAESPVENYTDVSRVRHYVIQIGTISRAPAQPAIVDDDIVDDRDMYASSSEEVVDSRLFQHFDVGTDHDGDGVVFEQPRSLAERLSREDSWIVVGPDGDPGIYTGARGLIDALALPQPHSIFLRNGIYDFTALGTLTIPDRVAIMGESKMAVIVPDRVDGVLGIEIRGRAVVQNVGVFALANMGDAVIRIVGRQAALRDCWISSRTVDPAIPTIHLQRKIGAAGGPGSVTLDGCVVYKPNGIAVLVETRTLAGALAYDQRTEATASIGSTPIFADTEVSDSFGVVFRSCRIHSGGASGDDTGGSAALKILGGASVSVVDSTIRGDGCACLYISTVSDAQNVSRASFTNCTFLARQVASTDFDSVGMTKQVNGDVIYVGCTWDTIGYDGLRISPRWSALVYMGGRGSRRKGSASFVGGTTTLASGTGASSPRCGIVAQVLSDDTGVTVEGHEVRVVGGDSSTYPVVLASVSPTSRVVASDVRVVSGQHTLAGIHACGNVTVDGAHVDGLVVPQSGTRVADLDDIVASTVAGVVVSDASIDLVEPVEISTACVARLNRMTVAAQGGGGVLCAAGGNRPDLLLVEVRELAVDGRAGAVHRTSYGLRTKGISTRLLDSSVLGVKLSAACDLGLDGSLSVERLEASSYGQLFVSGGKFVNVNLYPEHLAAVYGAAKAVDVHPYNRPASEANPEPGTDAYYGVVVDGGKPGGLTTVSGRFDGLHVGVHVKPVLGNVEVHDSTFTACLQGLNARNTLERTTTGLTLRNLGFHRCGPSFDAYVYGYFGLSVGGIVTTRSNDGTSFVIATCERAKVNGFESSTTSTSVASYLLSVTDSDDASLCGLNLVGGASPALYVSQSDGVSVVGANVTSNVTASGFSAATNHHGIVVSRCSNIVLTNVVSSAGLKLADMFDGTSVLSNVTCTKSNLLAWAAAGNEFTRLNVKDSSFRGVDKAAPEMGAAVWISPPQALREERPMVERAKFSGCDLRADTGAISGVSHNPEAISARGRGTALQILANQVAVESCEIVNNVSNAVSGFAAVVGDFSYIAGTLAGGGEFGSRRGVYTCRFVNNVIYSDDAQVVIIGKPGMTQEVRGNVWQNGRNYTDERYPQGAAYTQYVLRLLSEDGELSGENWARTIYIDNEHYLADRTVGASTDPRNALVITSNNVLLDAHLSAVQWHDAPTLEYVERVTQENSVWQNYTTVTGGDPEVTTVTLHIVDVNGAESTQEF